MLLSTLADTANGGTGGLWVVFGIFFVIAVVLLSGHGAGLIAGYNTASKAEKAKYDEKKLCRVTGTGIMIIAILILVMTLFMNVLPASFAYVFFAVVVVDCVTIIVLSATCCKKKQEEQQEER